MSFAAVMHNVGEIAMFACFSWKCGYAGANFLGRHVFPIERREKGKMENIRDWIVVIGGGLCSMVALASAVQLKHTIDEGLDLREDCDDACLLQSQQETLAIFMSVFYGAAGALQSIVEAR